jgi:NAD(P)-dependent dehydrogenase (short-subunit alcohol dehydrogenase family)
MFGQLAKGKFEMQIDLTGKRAVVSGSTAGIGLAIARGLAAAGAHVFVNGRTEARVEKAIADILITVPNAALSGAAGDMETAAGAAALVAQAKDADILVNNVGSGAMKPFGELTDEDWMRLFELNVMSGVRLTRHYLPAMVERGWGRVIFISSESALNIPKEMIHYGMTKTAQLAVSRGVAESVAGTGVTVNTVLPGPTRSETLLRWLEPVVKQTGKSLEEVEQSFLMANRPTSLIKRFASTEEVANMVVYVCSQQASATTGAALRVDGGVVRFVG